MRDTSGGVIKAFFARKSKRGGSGRYKTDGTTFWLWGNNVAEWKNGKIRVCDAKYQSMLTKKTLNTIFDYANSPCQIFQERHVWKLNCGRRPVKWTSCVTIQPRGRGRA